MKIFHAYKFLNLFFYLKLKRKRIIRHSSKYIRRLIQDSWTTLYIIRGNLLFSEYKFTTNWLYQDKPVAHKTSQVSVSWSAILHSLDGESTPNKSKQGSYEPCLLRTGKEESSCVSLTKWKVTICSCPTRKRQTLRLAVSSNLYFLSMALRDPFFLSSLASLVRAMYEKHVHKTDHMSLQTCNRSRAKGSCVLCTSGILRSHANMQGRIDYPDGIFVQPFRAYCYIYIALLRNDIDVREKTLLTYLEVHLLLNATDVLICTRHCIKR